MRRYLRPIWWRVARPVHLPMARRRIAATAARTSLDEFVHALWEYDGPSVYAEIAPMQIESELAEFLGVVAERRPRVVLEVGTATGGSLFGLAHVASPDAFLFTIDLPGAQFGSGYPPPRAALYRSFASEGQTIELLRGDSHSAEMRDRVLEQLGGRSIDLLFIDGDHSYDGSRRDFELYAPLVGDDGAIAMHDVNPHPDFGVHRLWQEIRGGYEEKGWTAQEIVHRADRPGYGIGVLASSTSAG
jgi:predicted O-methyltransferase YrrM